jgi:ABC transporter, ATP-binding protein
MIVLDDFSFTYTGADAAQKNAAVKHIGLTIERGSFVLLCGASGCGKTTVTRAINGLIPHYYEGTLEGSAVTAGLDVAHSSLFELSFKIGSVFQNPRSQFFNVDTTGELAFTCENHGMPESEIEERVRKTAEHLHLTPLLGRSIFELSGGEKQKIACGSAAASRPEVMVFDEPSSNLDAQAVQDLRRLLEILKADGTTIIVSEHRLYYLRGLIDRVVYIKEGCIAGDYTAEAFSALSDTEREAMGLRPLSLDALKRIPFPDENPDRSTLAAPLPDSNRDARNHPLSEHTDSSDAEKTTDSAAASGQYVVHNFRLSYAAHSKPALAIERLCIPKNSAVAVIGKNGAGKSTFLRCLCGLEKRCKGTLTSDSFQAKGSGCMAHCYMVMQDVNHQLFTESALEEVLLSMRNEHKQEAQKLLEETDLLAYQDAHPMSLSGGQKQRLAIASALASERPLLLFDEPTSGLDLMHMRQTAQSIRRLTDAGKTVITATHDPEFILRCCNYVVHLEEGTVQETYTLNTAAACEKLLSFFSDVRM